MSFIKVPVYLFILVLPRCSFTKTLNDSSAEEYTEYRSFELMKTLFVPVDYPTGQIPTLNHKIYRGMRVAIREHPYVVSIRRLTAHYLTGSLISRNLVITTADNIYMVPTVELRVVVGENYSDRGTTMFTVLLVVVHQQFDPNTLQANLALLRLYEDVIIGGPVKPIPLISPAFSIEGKTAFVTGWGRCDCTGKELCLDRSNVYFKNEKWDPMLRTVRFVVPHMKNPRCDQYQDLGLQENMLCLGAARVDEPMMPCSAVPGAPLVVEGALTGILSWGFGCGYIKDLPLIYVSVDGYLEWITHNVIEFSRIRKDVLSEIFALTKAQALWLWQKETRIEAPIFDDATEKNIEPLKVDFELSLIQGEIFDVRDFLYAGKYHLPKKLMYDNIRKIQEKEVLFFMSSTPVLRLNPFMGNETLKEIGISSINGSFIEDSSGEGSTVDDILSEPVLTTVDLTVKSKSVERGEFDYE